MKKTASPWSRRKEDPLIKPAGKTEAESELTLDYDAFTELEGGCTTRVPKDQCMWADHKVRIFHTGPLYDRLFTGQVEIYLKNAETGKLWECTGGKATAEADKIAANKRWTNLTYTDVTIPEGSYISEFDWYW